MNLFQSFQFNTLMHPWVLYLAIAIVPLVVAECVAHAPGVMRVSTGDTAAHLRSARGTLLRRLPPLLRGLALLLLLLALARPMAGIARVPDRANVVDIMLCVDVSGSMKALDFVGPDGQYRDRLFVTKAAVRDFIDSRKLKNTDRFGVDRIGLILYAGFAWTQCPLTLDYGILEREMELAEIDEVDPRKQGTAIGSAIGLAVSRLRKSEAETKVIILLTDGVNNSGELDPLTAAHIARDYGIRVYTIGAGTEGDTRIPVRTPVGTVVYRSVNIPIDEENLREIARVTEGRFFRATDTDSLRRAYAEIDQLETTEIELGDYYEYEEAFMPYCLAGALAMLLSVWTRRLWLDPIP